jgi:hypothetical protein
MVMVSVS